MVHKANANLTPLQRKAKSNIEQLKAIGGKFFEPIKETVDMT